MRKGKSASYAVFCGRGKKDLLLPKGVVYVKYHCVVQKMEVNFIERKIRVGTYGIMRNTSRLQHLKRSQRNQAPGHQLLLAVAQEEKDNVRNLEIIRISSREQIRQVRYIAETMSGRRRT